MIDLVAQQIRPSLANLGWIDTVGGIAREQKIRVGDLTKNLPAFPDPDNAAPEYTPLWPDASKSAISYFEVVSNRKQGDLSGGRAYQFEAVLRLVVWINTSRLTPSSAIPQAMAAIVSAVSGRKEDAAPVGNIMVTPLQEVPTSPAIFARWTYDEAETQFLMSPYGCFAFEFAVQFTLSASCPVVNILKTDPTC